MGVYQNLICSPTVDDPLVHRLGNLGALRHSHFSLYINDRHPRFHTVDELCHTTYVKGFRDCLYASIVSLIFHPRMPYTYTHRRRPAATGYSVAYLLGLCNLFFKVCTLRRVSSTYWQKNYPQHSLVPKRHVVARGFGLK